jgi:hypothetical protein
MTEMTNTTAVRVPGATLQYEGPALLLIHGGVADSSVLSEFAARLTDRHTVVTYDRRGYGDSTLEDPDQEQSVELHADDAHRLLSESDRRRRGLGHAAGPPGRRRPGRAPRCPGRGLPRRPRRRDHGAAGRFRREAGGRASRLDAGRQDRG